MTYFLELHFDCYQLSIVEFGTKRDSVCIRSVRGKDAGAYQGYQSFQWTRAVRAVVALAIGAKLSPGVQGLSCAPHLMGWRGSLASSLDYAIDKEPRWLCEMFGVDSRGAPIIRRLVKRTNPGLKHAGPVALRINSHALPAEDITIKDRQSVVSMEGLFDLMDHIDKEDRDMQSSSCNGLSINNCSEKTKASSIRLDIMSNLPR